MNTIEDLFDEEDGLRKQQSDAIGKDYRSREKHWDLGTKINKISLQIGQMIAEEFNTWVFRSWNRGGYEALCSSRTG